MRHLLDHAAENGYGMAAFNVNNMEQIQAIMEAAEETDSPLILQASEGARKYANEALPASLDAGGRGTAPKIPVAMHQDHGSTRRLARARSSKDFTSVMMDGSLMEDPQDARADPVPLEYNVDVTRQVVLMPRTRRGLPSRAKLGCLGSLETEDGHGAGLAPRANRRATACSPTPNRPSSSWRRRACDALAVAIGTSHGAYKFTQKPTGDVLAIDRIEEIHRRLPNTHLVMHGSSSVPEELLDIIRMYGGYMKETYGVPVEEIREGIQHGVRKINVDTDIRLAMTGAMRRAMHEDPSQFDPRAFLKAARNAAKELCAERYEQFRRPAMHAGSPLRWADERPAAPVVQWPGLTAHRR